MPENIPTQLKVMYTRPVVALCETFQVVGKNFTIDDPDDLTEEWLLGKLGF